MYGILALIGITILAVVGVFIGLGSFLPWVIVPLCLGIVIAGILWPAIIWGLRTKVEENKEFDKDHGIR